MADHKPEPAPPSALIKVGGTNFASMTDASQIDSLKASAPSWHNNITEALKAQGKVRPEDPVVAMAQHQSRSVAKRISAVQGFRRGAPVIHRETGKKLTIIHASVGHTKKTNTPVHRVADKQGNVWDIKETLLKLRV